MPYLMGGFPDLDTSRAIGAAYAEGGADLVELGVPFSDPLADGPVIHAAGTAALKAGATVEASCRWPRRWRRGSPWWSCATRTSCSPAGADAFAASLRDAGASGLIVPDLPLEEAPAVLEACDGAGIALVPLVAPTTPDERLERIGARARGFLYTVSVAGTTGERVALVDRVRRRGRSAPRPGRRSRSRWASASARPSWPSRPPRPARTA